MSDDNLEENTPLELSEEFAELEAEAMGLDGEENTEKNEITEKTTGIETSELLLGVLSPLFDVLAPNWNIEKHEKMALCSAYGSLLDKYFPDGVGNKYGVEISAVLVTATVFGSRAGTPRVLEEKKPEKEINKTIVEDNFSSSPTSGAELGAT